MNETNKNQKNSDETEKGLVYYMCGYLLRTRSWAIQCKNCKALMLTAKELLPENFDIPNLTLSLSRGQLLLATEAMFETFYEVEKSVKILFSDGKHMMIRDSYENVIGNVSQLNLLNVCCNENQDALPQ